MWYLSLTSRNQVTRPLNVTPAKALPVYKKSSTLSEKRFCLLTYNHNRSSDIYMLVFYLLDYPPYRFHQTLDRAFLSHPYLHLSILKYWSVVTNVVAWHVQFAVPYLSMNR